MSFLSTQMDIQSKKTLKVQPIHEEFKAGDVSSIKESESSHHEESEKQVEPEVEFSFLIRDDYFIDRD